MSGFFYLPFGHLPFYHLFSHFVILSFPLLVEEYVGEKNRRYDTAEVSD